MFKKYYRLSFLIFSFLLLINLSGFAQTKMLTKGDAAPAFSARASLAGKEFNFSLKKSYNSCGIFNCFNKNAKVMQLL